MLLCSAITYSLSFSTSHIIFFFFNATATTEIYTLSLHDALPISRTRVDPAAACRGAVVAQLAESGQQLAGLDQSLRLVLDRKSTRLNSSHANISYAVFCLKKKKKQKMNREIIKTRQ